MPRMRRCSELLCSCDLTLKAGRPARFIHGAPPNPFEGANTEACHGTHRASAQARGATLPAETQAARLHEPTLHSRDVFVPRRDSAPFLQSPNQARTIGLRACSLGPARWLQVHTDRAFAPFSFHAVTSRTSREMMFPLWLNSPTSTRFACPSMRRTAPQFLRARDVLQGINTKPAHERFITVYFEQRTGIFGHDLTQHEPRSLDGWKCHGKRA